ncbi:MAG: hypothetical protein E7139_04340 [Rikenellaceae bacterium]|nr:hypothetical protein [Rikenellaceae bacterium]
MKSWLKYTLRTAAILLSATLLTTSCLQSDFDEPLLAGDTVQVSFNVGVDNDMVTRVGEGESIDKLLVAIYKQDGTFVSADIDNATVTDGKISGNLSFELLRNQNYKAVFFAYNSAGYTVSSDSQTITANYGVGVSNPELLDAFRGAIDFTATANTSLSTTLTRAVALFVVGAKNENFESGDVTLSLPGAPTAINTRTGATSATNNISLTFTPDGSNVDGNNDYTLLAMTYVLPGEEIQPTITTVDGDKQVANAITFAANKRYNLLGNSLFVNSSWGGEIEITSLPAENVDGNGWIHIKTAEELAYLIKNGDYATVAAGANISSTRADEADEVKKYHICPGADLDMSIWKNEDKPTTAVSFTNTIIDAGKWDEDAPTVNKTCDDGCYTIKGLTLANGIFGNANGVTVQNLNIEGATIGSNTAEGVGIIANTATGSLTLTNITVSGGTVTGANKVGGLVGYIDSATGTTATLTDCSSSATVNATAKAGALVGWFNGYDESEILNFIDCSTTSESTFTTPFCSDEQACFNTNDLALSTYEQHLLGGEEYCRGTINYGYVDGDGNITSERFFYRWDGVRKVTPLTENSSTSIYSPYDLADCQGKSITSMTFHNDVDMGGQGIDGKFYIPTEFTQSAQDSDDDRPFSPISTVRTLNGAKSSTDNYTVYNLYIKRLNSETGNAFIQTAGSTTTHKNINFNNCCTVATHKEVATDAKAYGAIVCCNIDATYTMENVHATECKVFALQKVGTLAARVNGTSTLTNCTVNNCYVENYKCMIQELFESGPKEMAGFKVDNVTANFFPYGEIGGMFGFIQGSSTLTSCKVRGTTIFAYGQNDTKADVKTSGWQGMIVQLGISALGLYYVPGRHVGTLIGDIRATSKITLTECSVDNESRCTNRWDKHCWTSGSTHKTYDYIGQCYIVKFLDSEGSVTVDSTSLTINKCSTKDGICYDHNVKGN